MNSIATPHATPEGNIPMDADTIHRHVITNLIKMIAYRGWIKTENIAIRVDETLRSVAYSEFRNIGEIQLDVNLLEVPTYQFSVTEGAAELFVGDTIAIFITSSAIGSNINKLRYLNDFLAAHRHRHKLIICSKYSPKVHHEICDVRYPNSELFSEKDLMLNLVDYYASPDYQLLTDIEKEQLYESYIIDDAQIKKIFRRDPGALYMYAKVGQVLRIIRRSELTGNAVDYRLVIPSPK